MKHMSIRERFEKSTYTVEWVSVEGYDTWTGTARETFPHSQPFTSADDAMRCFDSLPYSYQLESRQIVRWEPNVTGSSTPHVEFTAGASKLRFHGDRMISQ